ncbi:hypothetical protein [Frigoribacterium sp. VKM Ac-2530]|uniref:hypothetical protein n=1 Tax=Frigoribacterium sp. VKM Ac-2530 TaxID=2783822 RepID=UPI00188DA958|nr:hypothetical protein [Frigoribacterium sp. VKM Ac-2530]MBF4578929.1 hypothetical protein [Frigoribacterium sp. VKM Ac-2530]
MTGFRVPAHTELPQKHYAALFQLAEQNKTTIGALIAEAVRRQLEGAPAALSARSLADLPPAEIGARRWSPEHDEIVIALNKAGMADHEISKRMGVSSSTINNHRRALGLTRNFASRWAGHTVSS